jgi:hypothetical protein
MFRWPISSILIVGVLTAMAAVVQAQSREDWRATEDGEKAPPVSLQQSYHGVVPGSGNNLPRVEELRNKPGTWVTWPGFTMRPDGGSRVFLQTTVALLFDIDEKKKRVTLRFNEARVHLSNNRNPLVTTHFNTPMSRVYLKKRRKTLDLILELKVDATPEISQMTDQDGYHYLFVDFPPGTYPKSEGPTARPSYQQAGTQTPAAAPTTP